MPFSRRSDGTRQRRSDVPSPARPLIHWSHDILDLDNQNFYIEREAMSVMANAVELLNMHLLEDIAGQDRPVAILEVGCGAYSLVQQRLKPPASWEGIDVIDADRKGQPSVASRKASVENIPWPDGSFDIVLSNQSIEHWHEYGVDARRGLSEICRVLKDGGQAVLNFPIHLHGHRMFLTGDFDAIDRAFADAGLVVERRVAVVKSSLPRYQGWRICGFPDFAVRRLPTAEATSFVVEYAARKRPGTRAAVSPEWTTKPALSVLQRHLHYGLRYFVWKVIARMMGRDRVTLGS